MMVILPLWLQTETLTSKDTLYEYVYMYIYIFTAILQYMEYMDIFMDCILIMSGFTGI